jgi:trans-2,3-dihydro-3-hydroxyanthranilate isomerase
MASYDFVIADVFTEEAFGGNQLAVLPDATGLTPERMQRIAREFNFSETTFVLPAEQPGHARRVRIFTPRVEMPFAGHPTIGTAAVLGERGVLETGRPRTVEEGVGPVLVEVTGRAGTRIHAQLTIEGNVEERPADPSREVAAAALSLSPDDVIGTWSASVGLPFAYVHLASREAVDHATLDRSAWKASMRHAWASNLFLFAGELASSSRLYARMFGPGVGVDEDPATGSACAALAGVLATRSGARERSTTVTVEQGVRMGRPSLIEAIADVRDGGMVRVRVSGATVIVARGTLSV